MIDPLQAVASLILGFNKEKNIQKWCRLVFQLATSMVGSFLILTGVNLVAGVTVARAIGLGMIASAIAMYMILRRSELTKGMIFVAPPQEAGLEINGDYSVIERTK